MLPRARKGIGLLDSPKTPEYESIGPTRILPHLYIGCVKDALSVETRQMNDIRYIVNVSTTCDRPPGIPDENFLRIPVNDGYIDNLQPYFRQAHQFIDKVKMEKGKVMVHCQAGISRSAALTISYIMNSRRISCEQAYRFVKMMRPIVSPNFNFLGQLLEYEKELNLSTSPAATAGSKRKRLSMSLPLDSASSVTDSPQHSKRLVVENNNSISLSPASAMAGLKFEHSIASGNCPLPGPTAAVESTVVEMRYNPKVLPTGAELSLPKRCHSWNGLANLASASPSPTSVETTILSPAIKKIVGGPSRPRSLNLSMSSLAVPPAVLELNAKVDSDLIRQKNVKYRGSADNILEISEGSEESLSNSNSGASLALFDMADTTPKQQRLIFDEIETSSLLDKPLLLTKDGWSSSQPSLSPATPTIQAEQENKLTLTELTMSQPLMKTFQSSMEQLKTSITSAHTAPSHLSKSGIVDGLTQEIRRRSHSLGNLVSCNDTAHSVHTLCMKCGRTDKLNVCHGATSPFVPDYLDRPRSIHDSLEMIEVT